MENNDSTADMGVLSLETILIKAIIVFGVIALTSAAFFYWPNTLPAFYPTMEEAFTSCSPDNEYIRQIFFIDEHDDNLTILSLNESGFAVIHYLKNYREDGIWYACIATHHPGIVLSPGDPDDFSWEKQVFVHNRHENKHLRLHQHLGRRPLYGISRKETIFDLSINGYNVEDVIHIIQAEDVNLYFWYFSNFPLIFESEDEVIISFEAE